MGKDLYSSFQLKHSDFMILHCDISPASINLHKFLNALDICPDSIKLFVKAPFFGHPFRDEPIKAQRQTASVTD